MNSRQASKAELMAGDGKPAATSGLAEPTAEYGGVRSVLTAVVRVCWLFNIGLLLLAFGWVYFFGESRETIELMRRAVLPAASAGGPILDPSRLGIGVAVGLISIAVALIACVAMFASLFVGHGRYRTTRMWLVFMTIVCGWLGLAVSWPSVYWFGQQRRVKAVLPAATALVESLRSNWPNEDSELPDVGPFLAYPNGAPRAILPLRETTFPKNQMRYSAIERTGDDVMRFQLAGAESGAWLEWRRDSKGPGSIEKKSSIAFVGGYGNGPTAFVGGLDTRYEPVKVAQLGPGWFLVRYLAAGLGH